MSASSINIKSKLCNRLTNHCLLSFCVIKKFHWLLWKVHLYAGLLLVSCPSLILKGSLALKSTCDFTRSNYRSDSAAGQRFPWCISSTWTAATIRDTESPPKHDEVIKYDVLWWWSWATLCPPPHAAICWIIIQQFFLVRNNVFLSRNALFF